MSDFGSDLDSNSDSEFDSEHAQDAPQTSTSRVATEQSTGVSCQTLQFENIFNSKGETVLLRAGSKQLNKISSHDESCRHAALVVTKYWTSDNKRSYTELKIQSPFMKAAMKKLIPEYNHINIDLQHIIIRDEPRCLFHHRHELIDYRKACTQRNESQAAQHIQYLLDYMFNVLMVEASAFRYQVENTLQEPALDFNHLWMAFVPGDLIYQKRRNLDQTIAGQLFRLTRIKKRPGNLLVLPYWDLHGHYIDYNGVEFGHEEMEVTIDQYEGIVSLCDLEAVPLKYHRDKNLIQEKFLSRGKKFVALQGHNFKSYRGPAMIDGNLQHVSRPRHPVPAWVSHLFYR